MDEPIKNKKQKIKKQQPTTAELIPSIIAPIPPPPPPPQVALVCSGQSRIAPIPPPPPQDTNATPSSPLKTTTKTPPVKLNKKKTVKKENVLLSSSAVVKKKIKIEIEPNWTHSTPATTNARSKQTLQQQQTTTHSKQPQPSKPPLQHFKPPNNIDINPILDRIHIKQKIKDILSQFEDNKHNNTATFHRGIFIYGSAGVGKTHFVNDILEEMNYDIIRYDTSDVRNKMIFQNMTSNQMSNTNVLNMMYDRNDNNTPLRKKLVLVMDEIDGMNGGDKKGIMALIKLIRQKKTTKQKHEATTYNPIICIGNYCIDKKIKELMKVCNTFELKPPTKEQYRELLRHVLIQPISSSVENYLIDLKQYNLRKLFFYQKLQGHNPALFSEKIARSSSASCPQQQQQLRISVFCKEKNVVEDMKQITKSLIENPIAFKDKDLTMNETNRTTVAMIWHENIIEPLANLPLDTSIPFYIRILENFCYADYIDRITFQSQIWQFNEMSSLLKIFYNNFLFHSFANNININNATNATAPNTNARTGTTARNNNAFSTKIRGTMEFTKILTKYSNEFNNYLFIFYQCQKFLMNQKDMFAFFQDLRVYYGHDFIQSVELIAHLEQLLRNIDVGKLEIKRIYKYLDKKKNKTEDIIEEGDEDGDNEEEGGITDDDIGGCGAENEREGGDDDGL